MKKIKENAKKLYWKVTTKRLDGIGVIEIILILVIIIGLVLIFRNQIEAIVSDAFKSISSDKTGIEADMKITPIP
jgi:Sec-independent protein translocase protein TatA